MFRTFQRQWWYIYDRCCICLPSRPPDDSIIMRPDSDTLWGRFKSYFQGFFYNCHWSEIDEDRPNPISYQGFGATLPTIQEESGYEESRYRVFSVH